MVRPEGLCQPTLVTDREMHSINQATEGDDRAGVSTLAISAMVLSTLPTLPRVTENPPRVSGSHIPSAGNRSSFFRSTTSSGCMACLRRHYEDAGVSQGAARLLLSSWRPSTSRHYNSAWGTGKGGVWSTIKTLFLPLYVQWWTSWQRCSTDTESAVR